MENVYPTYEKVEFEEIYGRKRENAFPPRNKPTYLLNKDLNIKGKYKEGMKQKWYKKNEISEYEKNINFEGYLEIRDRILELYNQKLEFLSLTETCNCLKPFKFNQVFAVYTFLDKLKMINNRDIISECAETLKNINIQHQTEDFIEKGDNNNIAEIKGNCACGTEGNFYSKNNILICSDCLSKGKYPLELNTSDFYLIEKDILTKAWTKREEIKLLEAIEKFGDDWTSVSQYVETKTKHECIYHFIMIPILENNLSKIGFATHMPFMLTTNPVSHILVFLSSIIHPSVAASVAKISIKEISNQSQNLIKTMILEAKRKCLEIIELEKRKIKRLENVIDESLTNLIILKIRSLKSLYTNIDKVKDELIEARKNIMNDEVQ